VFVDWIVKGAVGIIPTVEEITTKLNAGCVTALAFGGKDTEEVLKMSTQSANWYRPRLISCIGKTSRHSRRSGTRV